MRRILFAVALLVPGTLSADTLNLAWDPVYDSTFAGFRVYVGTSSRSYTQSFDVGNMTTFSFTQAVPGQRYYFAVASYTADYILGSKSVEVSGYSNRYPILQNPGNQTSVVGSTVTLQLAGSDPDGVPVSYSASGLPPGLLLTISTGRITGTPTTTGTFVVSATASDGVLASAMTFSWTITATSTSSPTSSPSDTGPPKVVISSPIGAVFYETKTPTLTLAGSATDDTKVVSVSWTSNRGPSGVATGTTAWSAPMTLQPGPNAVTVTAKDAAGYIGSSTAALIYVTPPTPVSPKGDIKTTHPTYVWNASPLATKYVLRVKTSTLSLLTFTIAASDAGCASTTVCSFTPTGNLPLGSSSWQVDAIVLTDLGAWSSNVAFKVLAP